MPRRDGQELDLKQIVINKYKKNDYYLFLLFKLNDLF
jgi:hypothetical protein